VPAEEGRLSGGSRREVRTPVNLGLILAGKGAISRSTGVGHDFAKKSLPHLDKSGEKPYYKTRLLGSTYKRIKVNFLKLR
jgi:hypothetical protein